MLSGPTSFRDWFSRLRRNGTDFSAYVIVRLLVAVIQTLPPDMGDSMCRAMAWLATGPIKIRRGTTEQNLSRVFPDSDAAWRDDLSRRMWHHLLLMVCEIAWAQRRLHRSNWSDHVRIRDPQKMLQCMLSKRPSVTVTGHFGNFEIGGYVSGVMGLGSLTIARKLDNPFLHTWVERFRSSKGQYMVDKEGCAPEVERHLKNGGRLVLLADQHAGPKGCWVNFMGVPASCHKALALFSLSSGAPMVITCTRRVDNRPMQFELACYGVADPQADEQGVCQSVTTLTEWYNQGLEVAIGESQEQYWWLHRRWREPPEKVSRRLEKQRQRKLAA